MKAFLKKLLLFFKKINKIPIKSENKFKKCFCISIKFSSLTKEAVIQINNNLSSNSLNLSLKFSLLDS